MIETLITTLETAFEQVIGLVEGFFGAGEEGGVFGAIGNLSSNLFDSNES